MRPTPPAARGASPALRAEGGHPTSHLASGRYWPWTTCGERGAHDGKRDTDGGHADQQLAGARLRWRYLVESKHIGTARAVVNGRYAPNLLKDFVSGRTLTRDGHHKPQN
jgi:hypothetical protein